MQMVFAKHQAQWVDLLKCCRLCMCFHLNATMHIGVMCDNTLHAILMSALSSCRPLHAEAQYMQASPG